MKDFEAVREIDGVTFYSQGYLNAREIVSKKKGFDECMNELRVLRDKIKEETKYRATIGDYQKASPVKRSDPLQAYCDGFSNANIRLKRIVDRLFDEGVSN